MDEQDKADQAAIETMQFDQQNLELDLQQKKIDIARKIQEIKARKKFAPTSGIKISDMSEVKSDRPINAGAARPGGVPQPLPR